MLLHIPVFSAEKENASHAQLFLVFAALESFYANENDAPLLVTTNNEEFYDMIVEFRFNTNYPFNVEFVPMEDIKAFFGMDDEIINSTKFINYFASKFHPVIAKLDKRILHIDYDVIFQNKIDFELYFEGPITLTTSRVNPSAINTGVLAMQQSSYDSLKNLFTNERLFRTGEWREYTMNMLNDETLLIDLHNMGLMWELELSEDFNRHLLAYELEDMEHWEILPTIIHFHWYKPYNCKVTQGGPNYGSINVKTIGVRPEQITKRFNNDFYKAILKWYEHLDNAKDKLPKSLNRDILPSQDDLFYELYRNNLKEGIYHPPLQTSSRRKQLR